MQRNMKLRHLGASVTLALIGVLGNGSWAQDQPTAPRTADDAEWRAQMDARLRQLEQENRELRQQVGQVADTQQALIKDAQSRGILTLDQRPEQTTPEFFDLNKYAAEGDFPGSIRLPGSNTSIQIGGFVQLDMLFDFDRIGSRDNFIPRTIPTDIGGAGETNFSARQTRLFVKTTTPTTNWGMLTTYVETDFFGSDNSAELRLRHAYGEVGDDNRLLGGQTWSVFVDASAFPATLDQEGASGEMITRRPQLRYTRELPSDFTWAISLEDPNPDFTNVSAIDGESLARFPALASNIRMKRDWGHLQLAGLLRQLTFDPDIGSRDHVWGWGLNFTGQINLFEKDKLQFQLAGGDAIADYMNDTNGVGLDGFFDGTDVHALMAAGAVLGYQHWWSKKWDSNFIYSVAWIEDDDDLPGSVYNSGQYAVVNLRWHPAERVMLGGELLYGVREDQDGDNGEAFRVQFSAQYRF